MVWMLYLGLSSCLTFVWRQYLPPLLVGIRAGDNLDTVVIPTLRALACVLLLGRFWAHTSDTLGLLEERIREFGLCAQVRS